MITINVYYFLINLNVIKFSNNLTLNNSITLLKKLTFKILEL